jgi:hypothetical protein
VDDVFATAATVSCTSGSLVNVAEGAEPSGAVK